MHGARLITSSEQTIVYKQDAQCSLPFVPAFVSISLYTPGRSTGYLKIMIDHMLFINKNVRFFLHQSLNTVIMVSFEKE
jgi:hypothetical protein